MGVDTYHFSITWSKLFPTGGADEQPDAEYELYIERLLDGLMAANIKAVVTIFSWGFNLTYHYVWLIHSVKPFKSKNRDKIDLDAPNPNLKKGCDRDFLRQGLTY